MPATVRLILLSVMAASAVVWGGGCPRGPCTGGSSGEGDSGSDDSGIDSGVDSGTDSGVGAPDGCVPVSGACGASSCCAADPAGNALTCDADGGVCKTTCGQLYTNCAFNMPCCAGTFGGYRLECFEGACARCLGAGSSCSSASVLCCMGLSCLPDGNPGSTCQ